MDARVERLGKQLDLNEVQRFNLKKLLENQQAESDRLWNDQKIEPMDRMTRLRALQDNTRKQFEALLTEAQRKKYDELLQQVSHQSPSQQDSHKTEH